MPHMRFPDARASLETIKRPDGRYTVYAPLLDGTWSAVLYAANGVVVKYGHKNSRTEAIAWADEQWAKKGKQS